MSEAITRVTVSISSQLDASIEAVAKNEGRRKMWIVREALSLYLQQRKSGLLASFQSNGPAPYLSSEGQKRVTLLIQPELDEEIEAIARQEGFLKMRLIAEALACYLRQRRGLRNSLRKSGQPPARRAPNAKLQSTTSVSVDASPLWR